MVDRLERMTNLVALLLETREPLTLVQIAGALDGQYPDGAVARRGAFERDKATMREVGVPLSQTVLTGHQAGQTGYWIERSDYELDGLDLEPDETRALQVAVGAVHLGSNSGEEALWKLGSGAVDGALPVSAAVPDVAGLPDLNEAVSRRATVEFSYRRKARILDPYGLLLRDGFWYVVGFDHERGEQRVYRVDRIDGNVKVGSAGSFERPEDFSIREAFPSDPKQLDLDGTRRTARVHVDAARAGAVVAEVGDDRVVSRHANGDVEVEVAYSNTRAMRSWVLGMLDHAVVLEPDDLRSDVVRWLESTIAAERGS